MPTPRLRSIWDTPPKARAAICRALDLGIEPHNPCTLARSESVCAKLVENTFPNAPVGTRAKITMLVPSQETVIVHVILDEDTIWFEYTGAAVAVETGAFTEAVFVLRVYDMDTSVHILAPTDTDMDRECEVVRKYVSGAVKNGTYITGLLAHDIALASGTDANTGELLPPEEGVEYVGIGDVRMSSRRDLSSMAPADDGRWGNFCDGGHFHDEESDED